MENLSKKQIIVIGIIAVIIVVVIVYYFFNNLKKVNYDFLNEGNEFENNEFRNISVDELENSQGVELDNKSENEVNDKNNEEGTLEKDQGKLVVHIAGAVNNEGIVILNKNSRIIDAITEAGGLKEDADLTNVNLAYIISDGQKIYIPHINDNIEAYVKSENGENIVTESTKDNLNENVNKSANSNEKININTASLAQLLELPGVGGSTAQKIINYRNENGKFNSVEDIKNVSGIGDAKFNNIKDFICVK